MPPDDLLSRGPYLSLAQAGRLMAVDGRPLAPNAVWRQHCKGVRVGDRRVKLPAMPLGKQLVTTERAVAAFLGELAAASSSATAAQPGEPIATPEPSSRNDKSRRRDLAEASAVLAKAGI